MPYDLDDPEDAALMETESAPRASRLTLVGVLLLLVLLAAAAGLGAAAVELHRPARYTSSAVLLMDQEPLLSQSRDAGVYEKLVRLRVKYADMVRTTTFADAVSPLAGASSQRVHEDLSAVVPAFSLLLTVTATDHDSDVARQVAQMAAQTLQDRLTKEQAELGIKQADRVTLTIVSPTRGATKVSPVRSRAIVAAGAVALAVFGGGLVLVAAIRRRGR